MVNTGNRLAVVALFAASGIVGVALNVLASSWTVPPGGIGMVHADTILGLVATSPSMFFTVTLLLAGAAARSQGWLPGWPEFTWPRVACGALLSALTFPVAFAAMIVTGLTVMVPVDSDRPNPPPVAPWRHWLSEEMIPIMLLVGGILTVWLVAVALRFVTRQWPRCLWAWAFGITIGVLAANAALVFAFNLVRGLPQPRLEEYARYTEPILFAPALGTFPLILTTGQPVLAAAVGHWLYSAAQRAEETA